MHLINLMLIICTENMGYPFIILLKNGAEAQATLDTVLTFHIKRPSPFCSI